jgi:putative ABC transport system substrate-binding protein
VTLACLTPARAWTRIATSMTSLDDTYRRPHPMGRRRFIATTACGLLVAPFAVEAQERKVYRVGFLLQASPPLPGFQFISAKALQNLGYIEGRNIVFDRRWAEGRNERFPVLAAELVALKPDVIVTDSTPAGVAAMRATATIPIVLMNVSDPVGSGLVASLARPGGNITGVTDFGTELSVKGVDLLRTVVPKAKIFAVLMSDNPVHPSQLKAIEDAAKTIGITVVPILVRSQEEFVRGFASMTQKKAGAMILLGGAPFSTEAQRDNILALAAKTKVPGMYPSRWFVDAGGLLSYGPSTLHKWALGADYIDKILKGAKPGDLPVQQPKEFELAINLRTAKALRLTLPPSLLVRADHIIE